MKNKGDHKSHGLLMLLCCLVPIILLGILSSLNLPSSGMKNVLSVLLVLACPLGHLLMMKFMVNNHKHLKEEMGEKRKEILNCTHQ
ncbi:MAG TPA: hypothetical protein DEF42_10820 [Desulfosporosinus sp.]|nr:hypothetical protein [Desulfosporosinus sp.]